MLYKTLSLMFLSMLLVGCETLDFDIFERKQRIFLSEVPPEVLDVARNAVAGIQLTDAEVEDKKGQRIYKLVGAVGGQDYEIEVSSTGEVIEIESESD